MVIRRPFIRRPLVGRRAVAGVARLHSWGVALGLAGLTLRHQQFGGLSLHGGAARRCLAVSGYAARGTGDALLTDRDRGLRD